MYIALSPQPCLQLPGNCLSKATHGVIMSQQEITKRLTSLEIV